VAFLLTLFSRYYGKLPRNVNVVRSHCKACSRYNEKCGGLSDCKMYCGCGSGVPAPLDDTFNLGDIPEIRRGISTEIFPSLGII